MIVNIRGTNGSGKSTIVKTFLQRKPHTEIFGALGPRRPEAYKVRLPGKWLYAIGPYHSATGGVDALGLGAAELVALLEKYRKLGHVIFEGVVISTYFGAVGEWLLKHKDEVRVVFLGTPLDVCLNSISSRDSAKRGTKNVATKIRAIDRVRARMVADGIPTEVLFRDEAFQVIEGWLNA